MSGFSERVGSEDDEGHPAGPDCKVSLSMRALFSHLELSLFRIPVKSTTREKSAITFGLSRAAGRLISMPSLVALTGGATERRRTSFWLEIITSFCLRPLQDQQTTPEAAMTTRPQKKRGRGEATFLRVTGCGGIRRIALGVGRKGLLARSLLGELM